MFLEQDLKLLGEVFSLARVHTVNSQPTNRQALRDARVEIEAEITNQLNEE